MPLYYAETVAGCSTFRAATIEDARVEAERRLGPDIETLREAGPGEAARLERAGPESDSLDTR